MTAIALTASETLQLTDLEGIIEAGMKTFVEVGAAIRLIRDKRLYRTTHSTFEDYCQDRWDWSRQRASQLIVAADVVAELSTIVDTPPANEAQARELAKVPKEDRAEVWDEVVENAPVVKGKAKITARQVKRAAGAAIEKPAPDPEDVAFGWSQEARKSADRFLSAVRALLPHVANLGDVERSACAYTIVHTCNAVMQELEDHGEVENTVVVGVLGGGAKTATEKTDTKSTRTKAYRGRSPLEGVRTVIGTLAGLVSGFDTVTAADCAPDATEAEEWEADLKNAVNLINRFRRTLKEHRVREDVA